MINSQKTNRGFFLLGVLIDLLENLRNFGVFFVVLAQLCLSQLCFVSVVLCLSCVLAQLCFGSVLLCLSCAFWSSCVLVQLCFGSIVLCFSCAVVLVVLCFSCALS